MPETCRAARSCSPAWRRRLPFMRRPHRSRGPWLGRARPLTSTCRPLTPWVTGCTLVVASQQPSEGDASCPLTRARTSTGGDVGRGRVEAGPRQASVAGQAEPALGRPAQPHCMMRVRSGFGGFGTYWVDALRAAGL